MLSGIPDVEELFVASRGDGAIGFVRSPVERRTNVHRGVRQLGEGNFKTQAFLQTLQVIQYLGDDQFMLSVSSGGNFGTVSRFEIPLALLRRFRHASPFS